MRRSVIGKSTGWATGAGLGVEERCRYTGHMFVVLLRGFGEKLNMSH